MNFYEAQDFMKQMYPGKVISFGFDEACHRTIEIIYTDGKPNLMHHVEFSKVKVSVEGMVDVYIPIAPHRMAAPWSSMKGYVNACKDVYFDDKTLETISGLKESSPEEYSASLKQYCEYSGLSSEEIEQKLKV